MKYTTAYHMESASDVCPHCFEVLWAEWGYWSEEEMLLWDGFYYQWDMPCSHYRECEPDPVRLAEASRRTQFVHMWAHMYPWTQDASWQQSYYGVDPILEVEEEVSE